MKILWRACLFLSSTIVLSAAMAGESGNNPKPLASVQQLMLGIVIPTSDVVFKVANDEGERDATGWRDVEANAWSLAEAGMLLKIGPRVTDHEKGTIVSANNRAEWLKFAQQLTETATAAARLAATKDQDKVVEAGFAIYDVCDHCHQKFMAARAGEP